MSNAHLLTQGVDALKGIGLNYAFVLDPAERQAFVRGLGVTVQLALLTIPGSLLAGVVMAAFLTSERTWLARPARAFVEITRNTPTLVQLYCAFLVLNMLITEQLRDWGGGAGVRVSLLRIPGIYAPDREGGTPRTRLQRGTAVLRSEDDVYTNHIHADDLARACLLALWRGKAQRIYHASDDTQLKMGDYFDLAADLYGLARPPRISREQAQTELPASLLSFMSESRRLSNQRLKRELRLRLRYPTVTEGLQS